MGGGPEEVPETPEQRAAADVAMEQWRLYQNDYRPFEEKWIKDVTAPTATREAKVASQVNADVAQKTGALPPPGTDPRRFANVTAGNSAPAKVAANAQAIAGQAVKDQRIGGIQAVVDLGMGKKSDADLMGREIAKDSVDKAIGDAQYRQSVNSAYASGAMSALGAGAAIYNNMSPPVATASPVGEGGVMTATKNNLKMDTNWWEGSGNPWDSAGPAIGPRR
jgi:hypothetical protein